MFDQLNDEKRKYKRNIAIGIIITLAAFVLFIPVMMTMGFGGFPIIVIPFFGGFIFAAINGSKIKVISQSVKEKYVLPELQKIIPNANYRMHDGFTEQEVIDSGLLRNQDRFHSEDMIDGVWDDVHFLCSDVKQEDVHTDSKGHTHTTTIFLGRFYKIDLPTTIKNQLIIRQKSLINVFGKKNLIETESIKFNNELNVYSEDKQEAFYILTPVFMEKLIELDNMFKDKISFSFTGNKLYIAINNGKDTFEISAMKDIDESIFLDYEKEFESIKQLITTIQMNKNIFKS